MLLASSLFFLTLLCVILKPRGIQIGTSAIIGALFALLLGVVSFSDVIEVTHIVWDATLAFIGIIVLSLGLDAVGFFEWCAIKMAKLSGGSGQKMFIYSLLLGSLISALFANDGAALILTPILLAKMRLLKLNAKTIVAFLLAGGFISDSASLPFVFSNLTNILVANYFKIGFGAYFWAMALPFVVSVVVSVLVLWLLLRKDIEPFVDTSLLKDPNSVLKNKTLFKLSWLFLALLLVAYFIGDAYHIPISFFALSGAFIYLLLCHFFGVAKPSSILALAPWQIVWFSVGLYVVVYGLKNAGLVAYLSQFFLYLQTKGELFAIVATGFTSAILSAVMNNLPSVMIVDIALKDSPNIALAYANIIGCNIGPKMTPFGSLATLLWLHVLANKGVHISFWQYSKFGLIVTPPVLLTVLLSLGFVI